MKQLHPNTLKVLTLNIAHGKGCSHRLWSGRRQIEAALERIGALLRQAAPDVAALQEADSCALWSGRIDQVRALSATAGFPACAAGSHVDRPGFRYGTALLSKLELHQSAAVTFPCSVPSFRKGFTAAAIHWPDQNALLDIVSLHLDFLRRKVRARQVAHLADFLERRTRPTIIMGDFNAIWEEKKSAVRSLAHRLELEAFAPASGELSTFPQGGKRMDWILISKPLCFISYRVLPDTASDHFAVLAEIGWPGAN